MWASVQYGNETIWGSEWTNVHYNNMTIWSSVWTDVQYANGTIWSEGFVWINVQYVNETIWRIVWPYVQFVKETICRSDVQYGKVTICCPLWKKKERKKKTIWKCANLTLKPVKEVCFFTCAVGYTLASIAMEDHMSIYTVFGHTQSYMSICLFTMSIRLARWFAYWDKTVICIV